MNKATVGIIVRTAATCLLLAVVGTRSVGAAPPGAAGAASPAPGFSAEHWLNTEPLTMADLRGRVVLVEFWTFDCYNCRNVEPYVKDWHARYADQGLVVVAVHSPEFAHEKKLANVMAYVQAEGIEYPVAVDNDFSTWHAWENRAWPTFYLVDRAGRVRYSRIGEGAYDETAAAIEQLLDET